MSSIWIEKWRPTKFEDIVLTEELTSYFSNCIKNRSIPHLLLHGKAGIGKTTIGKVIAKELGADFLYINGSKEKTIDVLRDTITRFASTYSNNDSDEPKIIFIDECEKITFQEALKVIMEEMQENCRFILGTNNISKIIEPLRDDERCQTFNLEPSTQEERINIASKYFMRIKYILDQEKVTYEAETLKHIIRKTFPSMRKVISTCNKTFLTTGKIGSELIFDDLISENLKKLINTSDILGLRKFVVNSDPLQFFREFFESFDKHIDPSDYLNVASLYGEYSWRNSSHDDRESNLFTFLVALCNKKIKFKI